MSSKCVCADGWTGESCGCPISTATCQSANGLLCSGRGRCTCGKCACDDPQYSGEFCEKCPACQSTCQSHWYGCSSELQSMMGLFLDTRRDEARITHPLSSSGGVWTATCLTVWHQRRRRCATARVSHWWVTWTVLQVETQQAAVSHTCSGRGCAATFTMMVLTFKNKKGEHFG